MARRGASAGRFGAGGRGGGCAAGKAPPAKEAACAKSGLCRTDGGGCGSGTKRFQTALAEAAETEKTVAKTAKKVKQTKCEKCKRSRRCPALQRGHRPSKVPAVWRRRCSRSRRRSRTSTTRTAPPRSVALHEDSACLACTRVCSLYVSRVSPVRLHTEAASAVVTALVPCRGFCLLLTAPMRRCQPATARQGPSPAAASRLD